MVKIRIILSYNLIMVYSQQQKKINIGQYFMNVVANFILLPDLTNYKK